MRLTKCTLLAACAATIVCAVPALAQEKFPAKPGTLNFGSAGLGSGTHINGEQFKLAAGIDVTHIPYKGTSEALTDTATARIHYFFSPLVPALGFIRDKRLIPLAVSTATRSPVLPDVPIVAEAALPGFEFDLWYGLLVSSKTPRPVIEQLSKEVSGAS
jgi:tripartite-type tricarboxylate transporter receptor subunit TctC